MRKAPLAEAALSLVTTRDRAAAITGDLLELSETTGRFWRLVACTIARQLWRQLTAAPADTTRAMFRIQVLELGLAALMIFPPWIATTAYRVSTRVDPPHWLTSLVGVAGWAAVSFLIGRAIARRYPGRELAVLTALLAFQHALGSALQIVALLARTSIPPARIVFGTIGDSLLATVPDLIVIGAGILYARARAGREIARA